MEISFVIDRPLRGMMLHSGTGSAKITTPCFEEVTMPDSGTITLKHTPKGTGKAGIPFIYVLNGDGTLGNKFPYAAAASATAFSFSGTTLTPPTGDAIAAGTTLLVIYEYDADATDGNQAMAVTNSASKYPTVCPNCGAPHNPSMVCCEYCGTFFE